MKVISADEVKKIQFDILRYFADFCDAHCLTYYLGFGTLIGAVRHHGYIPWDDDIDTCMPRKDYDKLLSLRDEISVGVYSLNAVETNPNFTSLSTKLSRTDTALTPSRFVTGYLYGVSIDIFPLDAIGTTGDMETVRREYIRFRSPYEEMVNRYHPYTDGKPLTGLRRILKKAAYRFAEMRYGPLSVHMRNYARMLADNNPEECAFLTWAGDTPIYKKEWFQERIKMDFESAQFYVPAGYDPYLKLRYGNYMEYPPENERVAPHNGEAYYLENQKTENANVP